MAAQVASMPATLLLTDSRADMNIPAVDVEHYTHGDPNGHTNGDTNSEVVDALTAPTQSFAGIPPFPNDVPTAPLLRISLAALLSHDTQAVSRFIRACEDLGFFYLDLSGCELGGNLQAQADQLFDVGEKLFELPVEEKKKYDFSGENSYFGYKGMGTNVVDRKGNLDRNEFYNVSKDDMLEIGKRWPAPDVLSSQRPLMKGFMQSAHQIVYTVLGLLNEHLKLPPKTLENLHRLEGTSGDQIRFLRAPPQPKDDRRTALGEHTDFGSVTVLFNRLGGLQVLPPGKDAEWCYVKPLPNHAIINLGDAMVKFTNGLLRSNIHRVGPAPGQQADSTKYSLVYFNRPEDEVVLKRLEGSDIIPPLGEGEVEEEVKSKDWILRRALGSRPAVVGDRAYDWEGTRGTEDKAKRAYL